MTLCHNIGRVSATPESRLLIVTTLFGWLAGDLGADHELQEEGQAVEQARSSP
jgi:hypothetical protein